MTIYKVLVRDPDGTTRLVSKSGYRSTAEYDYYVVRLSLLAARPSSTPVWVEENSTKPVHQPAC